LSGTTPRQKLHSEGHCAGSRDLNVLVSLSFGFFLFVYIQDLLLPLMYFLKIIPFSEAGQRAISIWRFLGRDPGPQSLPERCLHAASSSAACSAAGARGQDAQHIHSSHLQKHLLAVSRSKTGPCDYENMSV